MRRNAGGAISLDDAFRNHVAAVRALAKEDAAAIEAVATALQHSFEAGGKLLTCGNGGSAADSQHFVAEFVNHFRFDRPALPAMALSTDTSVLSSISNDARYEDVFARQVQAHGRPGDVLVGFSTSGRSANVLAAFDVGRALGLINVGFTGLSGAALMGDRCSILVSVRSDDTPRVQEAHQFAYHVIAEFVEERLFGSGRTFDVTAAEGEAANT